jgi:PTS system mannose-specific IIC component
MNILVCCIISFFCMAAHYFFPLYGYTGGNYILSKPLVGGMICGLLLGDLATGMQIGCAIQLTYLSYMVIGGAASVDQGFLAYPITAIAIMTKMDAGSAIALGTAVAIIAAYGNSLLRTINLFANSRYQAAIEEGNKRKQDFYYFGLPLFALFVVRFVPAFLMMYFGSEYVSQLLSILPETLLAGMAKFGNFMPAIGIALLMKFLIRKSWYLAFFVFGFALYAYLGMSVLGAAVFASVVSILYFMIISSRKEMVAAAAVPVSDEEEVL